MSEKLRLGTRGSALALAQAGSVAAALDDAEVVPIKTSGDRDGAGVGGAPANGGDKARFVREIEAALLAGEVDVGVHSAKDLPSELPDGLTIAGVPKRENPLDCWVGPESTLEAVPEGARVGTSSLRRRAQLLALRPDLEVVELRGNVDTRLAKLAEGGLDAIVLAAAGLARLGRTAEIAFNLELELITPAAGQGCLALEVRAGDERAAAAAEGLTEPEAAIELRAERAAVAALEASCNTPLGIHARRTGDRLEIAGFCGLPDGSEWIRDELEGGREDPEELGSELAERMRAAGADELLERAEEMAGSGAER
jgi:hydroxymethylbilane synthase